jgi:peptide subunit release factor RF-3
VADFIKEIRKKKNILLYIPPDAVKLHLQKNSYYMRAIREAGSVKAKSS